MDSSGNEGRRGSVTFTGPHSGEIGQILYRVSNRKYSSNIFQGKIQYNHTWSNFWEIMISLQPSVLWVLNEHFKSQEQNQYWTDACSVTSLSTECQSNS